MSLLSQLHAQVSYSYPVRLLISLTSLAGLLHDIGKANAAFQSILRGAETKIEEYRHEAVSVMLLAWLAKESSDEAWVRLLLQSLAPESPASLCFDAVARQSLAEELDRFKDILSKKSGSPVFSGCAQRDCHNKPVLFGLLWLILSHHRLPTGSIEPGWAEFDVTHYRRIKNKDNPFSPDLLSVQNLAGEKLPWFESSWLKRALAELQVLLALLRENEGEAYQKERVHLFDHLRLFARPAFQLADHWMSSLKKPSAVNSGETRQWAFANSVAGEETKSLGQLLHTHSIGVARYAKAVAGDLFGLKQSLPSVSRNKIPSSLSKATDDERFLWQDEAVKAIQENIITADDSPFFGLILSGTGSGKTIAALKMACSLQQNVRLVYASPLRSLTLQSGSAFEKLGFSREDLTTVIGDPLIKKMFEENSKLSRLSSSKFTAIDACQEFDDHSFEVVGGSCWLEASRRVRALQYLRQNKEEGVLKMISTPILAATLDTVMKLSDARRGGYLSHFLRIATSDLIIDEVDMYSHIDQIAIGRLIESCGFWRNKVFLSSATLNPITAKAFFAMYVKGLEARNALDGYSVNPAVGWFSNLIAPKIKTNIDLDEFPLEHSRFTQAAAGALEQVPVKRVTRHFATGIKRNDAIQPGRILQYVREIHQATALVSSNEHTFSLGCIQVVNVKHCQEIALRLCNHRKTHSLKYPEYDYRVICLHGRLSFAARNYIETRLDKMLNRSGTSGDLAPLNQQNVFDFCKQTKAKHRMVILVSTMETTGRDHDFDWGMIESRSERDIIQFAGRIRRHRAALEDDAARNIIILDIPLSAKENTPWASNNPKQPHPFARFGVGDKLPPDFSPVLFKNKEPNKDYGDLPRYSEMFSLTYQFRRLEKEEKPAIAITPAKVLTELTPSDLEYSVNNTAVVAYTVRACEILKLQNTLISLRPGKAESLSEWAHNSNAAGRLLANHAANYRFRSGHVSFNYSRKKDEEGNILWFLYDDKNNPHLQATRPLPLLLDSTALLFQFEEFDEVANLQNITKNSTEQGLQLFTRVMHNAIMLDATEFCYHEQLGIIAVDPAYG